LGGRCGHALAGADSEGVFGEAQSDAALDAVVQGVAVELMKSLGREGDVFELYEAHRAVLLGSEAQAFIAPLLGEHCLELVLGRVDRKVAHIESVAWRVLIGRVDWREVVSLVVLATKLITDWRPAVRE
jgi:hypothetical protein